jgi:hypothetical protein
MHSTGGGPWVEQVDETPAAAFWSAVAQSGDASTLEAYEGVAAAVMANNEPTNSEAAKAKRVRIGHLPVWDRGRRTPSPDPGKSCSYGRGLASHTHLAPHLLQTTPERGFGC